MSIIRTQYDRSYFESIAYTESPDSRRNRNRLEEVLTRKGEGKLLEIGCGTGGFLRLAARHFDVEGLDISKYAIDSSKRAFGPRIRVANIETEHLPSTRYDVIAAFGVLEHLKMPGVVIDRIHRALVRGGIAVGSVPNNWGLVGRVATGLMNLFDRTHCSTYPPHRWRALFEKSGFGRVSFFGEAVLSMNHGLFIKSPLWPCVSSNVVFLCIK